MCGIYLSCGRSSSNHPSDHLLKQLRKRGPDSLQTISTSGTSNSDTHSPFSLTAVSSVLSIRGDTIVKQPIRGHGDSSDSFVLWNGEAWRFDGEILQGNDAELVGHRLLTAVRIGESSSQMRKGDLFTHVGLAVSRTLCKVSGPFAFVFYDNVNRILFYGRDCLGRRSLLIRQTSLGLFEIASVSGDEGDGGFEEVNANGIYALDLTSIETISTSTEAKVNGYWPPVRIPWPVSEKTCSPTCEHISPFPPFNKDPQPQPALTLSSPAIQQLSHELNGSLSLRLSSTPIGPQSPNTRNRVAILFSGGLDCTLIARIAHDILPSGTEIDLLNVAFENPRVVDAAIRLNKGAYSSGSAFEACPDRVTGRASYIELCDLCPSRYWRFVAIDIPYSETKVHRPAIMTLLHPHNTEMDLSIGCALYFASRGQGTIRSEHGHDSAYATPARVLLSGLGADELFGGYQRHATAFDRQGHAGLAEELELDFRRIGERNLGRDDRIISHWGKEVRYPFLDEEVVKWALKTPVSQKCGFGQAVEEMPPLDPSKMLLRLLAWQLGLRGAAKEKKRAIQFGARTAKMEVGKKKGTQRVSETA